MVLRKLGEEARFGMAAGLSLFLFCCGGGGPSNPPPPPVGVSVSISPTSATVGVGATQQFTATVMGTSNTSVTWTVNGITGGNSVVGTISNSGLYTATNCATSASNVTVAATSQADTSKSASAGVTTNPLPTGNITSLNPIVAMQIPGPAPLNVNGTILTPFTLTSRVLFGGVAKGTTFVSPTQLTAQLAPGDLASPGPSLVTVQDSGTTTGSQCFFIVPAINPRTVSVSGGFETGNVNIDVSTLASPSLSFRAAGACVASPCSAGGTGALLSRQGQPTATLFLVGIGIVPGTFFIVSGPSDITVTQPLAADFTSTTSGAPAVKVRVSINSTATLGPRNILVTNASGEVAVFVGGLLITP